MTKITIISGFLGAGKTTLIRKLLEEVYPQEKKVLIENEYGEIGIDGSFLKDAGVQITELNSGCICCTLVGDFTEALTQVIEQFAPDRILIEPSGVGKLSDIVKSVERVKAHEDIAVTEKIAVVDAKKAKLYLKNFGEFFKDQVQHASTIVLSRTQLIPEEKTAETIALLRELNPSAPLISTPWDELGREAILHALENSDVSELIEDDDDECDDPECSCHHHHHHHHGHEEGECDDPECSCHHHHDDDDDDDDEHEHHHHHHGHEEGECDDPECSCHHHHDDDDDNDDDEHEHDHEHHHHHHGHHHHDADEVFISWGRETNRRYTQEELQQILDVLSESTEYGQILRAKGILPMTDGTWQQFDLVPEEVQTRAGSPDYAGRICVIGAELKEDALAKLFGLA
ncbi:MAG: GTP-binding protein [Lachnospiraceae bacterium]|nr:GTP-binding protein [Lachnospiraceae bacterium]